MGGGYSTWFVCVCVLPQNCCLNSIISKSKQAASHKLGNLRQTVQDRQVLTGKRGSDSVKILKQEKLTG